MSRGVGGTYTVPGNPVTTLTTITSSWANTMMTDLAGGLTDSLSRTGLGGMSAGLKFIDGTVSVPSFYFSSKSTSGMYLSGTQDLGFTVNGVAEAILTDTELTVTNDIVSGGDLTSGGVVLAEDGVEANPAFAFTDEVTTGFWRIGAAQIGFAGVLQSGGDGAIGAPSYGFESDDDTGMYSPAVGQLGFTVAGALRLAAYADRVRCTNQFASADGAVGAPGYAFESDLTTGVYVVGAGRLGVTTSGSQLLIFETDRIRPIKYISNIAGSAAAPSYSFEADETDGMYRSAANEVSIACNGVQEFIVTTTGCSADDFTATSDIRLKENIREISHPLDRLAGIRGVEFDWKEGGHQFGVIAQEVQEVLPEAVKDGEHLSVSSPQMIGLIVAAINELAEKIDDSISNT